MRDPVTLTTTRRGDFKLFLKHNSWNKYLEQQSIFLEFPATISGLELDIQSK